MTYLNNNDFPNHITLIYNKCAYTNALSITILNSNLSFVVATTHQNGTRSLLTSAKLTEGYLVVGITRELDKEPLLHCSFIYINTMWSVLQQCVYLMSYYSSTMLLPQGHHVFTSRLPCHIYVP